MKSTSIFTQNEEKAAARQATYHFAYPNDKAMIPNNSCHEAIDEALDIHHKRSSGKGIACNS